MEDLYDEVKDYQSEISEIILNNQENLEELLAEYHLFDISPSMIFYIDRTIPKSLV